MIPSAKAKINIFTECSLLSGANLGQIMDLAATNNNRFIVDRDSEPPRPDHQRAGFRDIAAPAFNWLLEAADDRGLQAPTWADIIEEGVSASRRRPVDYRNGSSFNWPVIPA
jgi:hypothetical protein